MHPKPDELEYLTSIYFKSGDRPSTSPINDFVINTNVALKGVDYLAVNHAQFYLNLYQFNQYNGILSFKYDTAANLALSAVKTVTLTNTSYTTLADLAANLQAMIRTATTDAGITVTVQPYTNKLIFTGTGFNFFQILIGSASYALGFGVRGDGTENVLYPVIASLVNPLTSVYPTLLEQTTYIDISSNFFAQYQREPNSGSSYRIPSKVLLRYRPDSVNLPSFRDYPIRHLLYIPWKYDEHLAGAVDLQLRDEFGNLLDVQNSQYNIEIACYRKKIVL